MGHSFAYNDCNDCNHTEQVATLKEVEELVVLGGRNRTVGSNNVNEHSSRSHLVLQVYISSTDTTSGYIQHGQLNLIDLAGSERIKVRARLHQRIKRRHGRGYILRLVVSSNFALCLSYACHASAISRWNIWLPPPV